MKQWCDYTRNNSQEISSPVQTAKLILSTFPEILLSEVVQNENEVNWHRDEKMRHGTGWNTSIVLNEPNVFWIDIITHLTFQ